MTLIGNYTYQLHQGCVIIIIVFYKINLPLYLHIQIQRSDAKSWPATLFIIIDRETNTDSIVKSPLYVNIPPLM